MLRRSRWYHVKNVLRQTWQHPSNRDHRVRSLAKAVTWQAEKRLRRKPRDVAYFGFTLRCYPDSQSASNVIYFTERYDPDEIAFAEAYLRPGDCFVDVGANIGTYAIMARSIVGADGHVDGFEPHPVAARRFRENVELNGMTNVVVHAAAVSDRAGRLEFIDGSDVSNRVKSAQDDGRRTIVVPAVNLDAALPPRRYAMGKIDVEGYETLAFRGATAHLVDANPPIWQIEILDHALAKAGSSRAELVALLEQLGYAFADLDRDASGPGELRLRWTDARRSDARNLWAVHRASASQIEDRIGSVIA